MLKNDGKDFMKSFRIVVIYLLVSLFCIKSVYSQDSKNLSLLGRFSEGPCFTVTSQDSIIFLGNGTAVDIVILKSMNIVEKKSQFVTQFLINDLEIKGNTLYVATDGGLYLINVSNISAPDKIGFFQTVGKCKSLFIMDNFVYLVDDAEGFHIIDISDPKRPNLLSTFRPVATKSLTQICATDTLAYLCDSMGELSIINTKDKNIPKLLSTYNFEGKYYPSAIIIKNNYAYVGTVNHQTPRYLGKIFVLDITDSKSTKQVYSNHIPGDWYSNGRDLAIQDSLLFLAYASDVGDGVEVYSISKPYSPHLFNSVSIYGYKGIWTFDSYSVSVSKNNLIIAEGGFGMSVFSLVDLKNVAKIISYETCNTVNDLFVENDRIFAACGYSGLNTFDQSNVSNIIKTTKPRNLLFPLSYTTSIYANNGLMFLTSTPSGRYGFQILQLQGDNSFNEVGGGTVEGNKVIVKNNYAYVAARFSGLYIFDISNPSQPIELFKLPFEVYGVDIELKENLCFLAASIKGIYILDISDPANPREYSRFQTLGSALGVAVKDSIVFVAEGSHGLRIFNYKNVSHNLLFNKGFTFLQKVRVEGNYLYLMEETKGLVIYDISDSFRPIEIGYYNLGRAKPNNIFIKENIIYVSLGYYGFSIYKNDLSTSVYKTNDEIPHISHLYQNYPNPFNPSTVINYQLPVAGNVSLKLFDILGREVATLVDEYKQPGNYEVKFDIGHFERSREIPSGIYFYSLKAGNYFETKKMVLIK